MPWLAFWRTRVNIAIVFRNEIDIVNDETLKCIQLQGFDKANV